MARRGDPNPPAGPNEVDDQSRTPPRLAGAGGSLNNEVALVKRTGKRLLRRQVDRLDRKARELADKARRGPRKDVATCLVACATGSDRAPKSGERVLLFARHHRTPRDERPGKRLVTTVPPPLDLKGPREVVDLGHPDGSPVCRIDEASRANFVILLRKRRQVKKRLTVHDGFGVTVSVEPGDRLSIGEKLRRSHLAKGEMSPPSGAPLPSVVVEEIPKESGRSTARDKCLPERFALRAPGERFGRDRLGRLSRGRGSLSRPSGKQPFAKDKRRPAVLFVVAFDRVKTRLLTVCTPTLIGEHRLAPRTDGCRALESRERLDLLETVAANPGADGLARHAKEITEHVATSQGVDLLHAGRVLKGEPVKGSRLSRAVVVEVHVGPPQETLVHAVDEGGERVALPVGIVTPERAVDPTLTVAEECSEEELQATRRGPKWVALDVEHDIPRRRRGKPVKSHPCLGGQRAPLKTASSRSHELEFSLVDERRKRFRIESRDVDGSVELSEAGQSRRRSTLEGLDLPSCDSGDSRQVVGGLPLAVAPCAKRAVVAVGNGIGRSRGRQREIVVEASAQLT